MFLNAGSIADAVEGRIKDAALLPYDESMKELLLQGVVDEKDEVMRKVLDDRGGELVIRIRAIPKEIAGDLGL